jgi:uncharacterized protein (DUF2147 family)
MRRWNIGIIAVIALVFSTAPAWAEGALGTWATEGGKSHVTIIACEDKLCGTIVWLKEPLTKAGKLKHDANNPDAAMQSRPIIGLPLLAGFVPSDDANFWDNGTIYNPENGEIYACNLTLARDGTLEVHGYVGLPMFGKTQIWTRVQ